MNKMLKGLGFSIGLIAAQAMLSNVAMAADGPIKERQAIMKDVGKTFGGVKKMVDGEVDFDAGAVKASGEKLAALFTKAKTLFPEGSGGGPEVTRAKDEIWQTHDDFLAIFDDAVAAANQLAAVTSEDALKPAFGNVGKMACGACHKPYRRPKN